MALSLDAPWRQAIWNSAPDESSVRKHEQESSYLPLCDGSTFDLSLADAGEQAEVHIADYDKQKPVSCEDIDETALSYAEIKALCAGDEQIKEDGSGCGRCKAEVDEG